MAVSSVTASTVKSMTYGLAKSYVKFWIFTFSQSMTANDIIFPWKISLEPPPSKVTSCISSKRIPMVRIEFSSSSVLLGVVELDM